MRQLIADDASKHIDRAAGRGRNNELDGLVGESEGAASWQSCSQRNGQQDWNALHRALL